jgi:hypothetical protein
MTPIRASVLVLAALLAACGGSEPSPPTTPSPPPSSPPVSSGFVLQGDPESAQGATWTYRGSLDGVTFDLQRKPESSRATAVPLCCLALPRAARRR